MVEQELSLDAVFGSLSDPTRRDILRRVSQRSLSIGALAQNYPHSFAGVAKHLKVLEQAGLIRKTRRGKEQMVSLDPNALAAASGFLESYRQLWEQRLDSLDKLLATGKKPTG